MLSWIPNLASLFLIGMGFVPLVKNMVGISKKQGILLTFLGVFMMFLYIIFKWLKLVALKKEMQYRQIPVENVGWFDFITKPIKTTVIPQDQTANVPGTSVFWSTAGGIWAWGARLFGIIRLVGMIVVLSHLWQNMHLIPASYRGLQRAVGGLKRIDYRAYASTLLYFVFLAVSAMLMFIFWYSGKILPIIFAGVISILPRFNYNIRYYWNMVIFAILLGAYYYMTTPKEEKEKHETHFL